MNFSFIIFAVNATKTPQKHLSKPGGKKYGMGSRCHALNAPVNVCLPPKDYGGLKTKYDTSNAKHALNMTRALLKDATIVKYLLTGTCIRREPLAILGI